jgi:hypothetical protein
MAAGICGGPLALDRIFLFGRPVIRWINSFGELERHVVA